MKCINEIGTFIRQKNKGEIPALEYGPPASFEFALPKIPKKIMALQVSFYREIMKAHQRAEAFSIIMFNKETQEYFLHIPIQKVSKGGVHYNQVDLRTLFPSEKYIEVMSCHSHNDMAAFFSGTDDKDEQGDMLYMVHGTLHNPVPTFRIRANLQGLQCCFVDFNKLFEMTEAEFTQESPSWVGLHPEEWMKQINIAADYYSPLQTVARPSGVSQYSWPSRGEDDQLGMPWEKFMNQYSERVRRGVHDFRGAKSQKQPKILSAATLRHMITTAKSMNQVLEYLVDYINLVDDEDFVQLLLRELVERDYMKQIIAAFKSDGMKDSLQWIDWDVKVEEEGNVSMIGFIELSFPSGKKDRAEAETAPAPAVTNSSEKTIPPETNVFTGAWHLPEGATEEDVGLFFSSGSSDPKDTKSAAVPVVSDKIELVPFTDVELVPAPAGKPVSIEQINLDLGEEITGKSLAEREEEFLSHLTH
jgi:PRTRC genetic system protein A